MATADLITHVEPQTTVIMVETKEIVLSLSEDEAVELFDVLHRHICGNAINDGKPLHNIMHALEDAFGYTPAPRLRRDKRRGEVFAEPVNLSH